jgi:Rrf2 family protein
MLSLTKKTDYALIALAHLAGAGERPISARDIAETYELPTAMLMNILKTLHHHNVVTSTRGTKGGYQLAIDPKTVSLYQLIEMIDGPVQMIDCADNAQPGTGCRIRNHCPIQNPIKALHAQFERFLKQVMLADLITPGHRIDVPVEMVTVG